MPILTKILGVEWLNVNSMRAYPIADGVTETDTSGSVQLPRELIVDLIFPIDTTLTLDTSNFFISQLAVFGPGVTITISYFDGTSNSVVGSVSVNSATHVVNNTYFIAGQGIFADCIGKITIGRLDATLNISGVFNFTLDATRLLGTLFRPDIRGVKSLSVLNGTDNGNKLYGDITLKAGQNFRLRVDNASKTIWFDALRSDELNVACGCNNEADLPPPIRTINGIPPDNVGNFQFVGDACMTFTPGGVGALEVKDNCSQPCCGSPELTVLETDFNQLNLDVRTMRNLLDKLETHLQLLDNLRLAIQSTGLLGDTPGAR